MDDLYCRLYVNDADERSLLEKVANLLGAEISAQAVFNEVIDFDLSKNLAFSENTDQPEFLSYPSTFEVSPRQEITDTGNSVNPTAFLDMLVNVIIELRNSGVEIVASCDYENLIAKRTGWNWSESTPQHPSLGET